MDAPSHTVNHLTPSAMTKLGIKRLVGVEVIGYPATVAAGRELHVERVIFGGRQIRRTSCPGLVVSHIVLCQS